MPQLVISPDVGVSQGSARKWLLAQVANVLTKSPVGSVALAFHVVVEQTYERTGLYRGPLGQVRYDMEKAWWHPDYQATTSDVYNQDPSKAVIFTPVYELESTRQVPSSSQQGRRRGGTSKKFRLTQLDIDFLKIPTAKVTWKSGKKGGKKRPTCPRGFRLRRVGKRLMCVKS